MTTTGGCTCGALTYSAEGEPDWAGWCHCRDCQRGSGSDRRPFMGFVHTKVTVNGPTSQYRDPADAAADPAVGSYFCPTCGTTVFGVPRSMPTYLSIYAGTLDDPAQFAPGAKIFCKDRWPQADAPMAEFAAMPTG